jgi:superfamily II DNA or RNA helicase
MLMKEWFEGRGLKILNYQTATINGITESLSDNEVTILAACPSAGKTIMSIFVIEDYLQRNPDHKIIVLTHGTTVLRTQFHDVLEEIKPNFTYNLVEKFSEYDPNASVNVCLPQTLHEKKLHDVDLLVCDEAHQFYFADMVQQIITKSKVSKQLLLTGTPSVFIGKNMNIIPVPLNTIFDEGMVSDVYVEIATSSYNFDISDYNQNDELKTDISFKKSETKKTLDDLITKIVDRLKSFRGNDFTNLMPEWLPTLKRLKKTMIACKSQQQAMQVKHYFDKIGVVSALSISDTDTYSEEIQTFTGNEECLVLIVVGRGILGFNYPELVNVVDMTTSMNIDRIYQLFCRVVRKHPKGEKKLFFKVAPNTLSDYYKYIMTGVLALSDEHFFTSYNGKNFNDMVIPVRRNGSSGTRGKNPDGLRGTSNKKTKKFTPVNFEGLPVFEFFKDIYHKKNSLLDVFAYTTMRDVRAEFTISKPNGYWTKENCIESALPYSRIVDWMKNENSAYNASKLIGCYDNCIQHMIKRNDWTKENCVESASNYTKKVDWVKNENSAYNAARINNWLEECCGHMDIMLNDWTKENCIESALKYKTIHEWAKGEQSAYVASRRCNWFEECTTHMTNNRWTIEKCMDSAKKYETIIEWINGNNKAYIAAHRHKWLETCTEHMLPYNRLIWTKEKCINDALKYDTIKHWQRGNGSAEKSARKNGWLEECTNHMKKQKKVI